jgi:hypothetical protein
MTAGLGVALYGLVQVGWLAHGWLADINFKEYGNVHTCVLLCATRALAAGLPPCGQEERVRGLGLLCSGERVPGRRRRGGSPGRA